MVKPSPRYWPPIEEAQICILNHITVDLSKICWRWLPEFDMLFGSWTQPLQPRLHIWSGGPLGRSRKRVLVVEWSISLQRNWCAQFDLLCLHMLVLLNFQICFDLWPEVAWIVWVGMDFFDVFPWKHWRMATFKSEASLQELLTLYQEPKLQQREPAAGAVERFKHIKTNDHPQRRRRRRRTGSTVHSSKSRNWSRSSST